MHSQIFKPSSVTIFFFFFCSVQWRLPRGGFWLNFLIQLLLSVHRASSPEQTSPIRSWKHKKPFIILTIFYVLIQFNLQLAYFPIDLIFRGWNIKKKYFTPDSFELYNVQSGVLFPRGAQKSADGEKRKKWGETAWPQAKFGFYNRRILTQ